MDNERVNTRDEHLVVAPAGCLQLGPSGGLSQYRGTGPQPASCSFRNLEGGWLRRTAVLSAPPL